MTTPENTALAALVATALNRGGISNASAAQIIGKSEETIRRRLKRGNFYDVELGALASATNTRPSAWYEQAGQ